MLFLLILYVDQLVLINCKLISKSNLKALRVCMTRAFMLIYLLSFQQQIKGAFTLVQCVKINGTSVLYIEGEIQCYTWWQTLIEIYIFSNLIPSLFVLSVLPYFLKEKRISLKVFHLACIFPIPILVAHICIWLFKYVLRYSPHRKFESRTISPHSVSGVVIELESELGMSDHRRSSLDTLGQEYDYFSSDTDIGSIYSLESEKEINIENLSISGAFNKDKNDIRGSREEVVTKH